MPMQINNCIKWSMLELKGLLEDEDARVTFQRSKRHLALHPFQLNDLKRALREILTSKVNFYDPDLQGLILAYKKPRLLDALGGILHDSCYIHVDIEADFYIFKPEVGCTLKGIANKKAGNHLGVLVHKVFNVSILKSDDCQEWLGDYVFVGQEVKFTVTHLDFKGKLPFVRGELVPDATIGHIYYDGVNNEELETKPSECLEDESSAVSIHRNKRSKKSDPDIVNGIDETDSSSSIQLDVERVKNERRRSRGKEESSNEDERTKKPSPRKKKFLEEKIERGSDIRRSENSDDDFKSPVKNRKIFKDPGVAESEKKVFKSRRSSTESEKEVDKKAQRRTIRKEEIESDREEKTKILDSIRKKDKKEKITSKVEKVNNFDRENGTESIIEDEDIDDVVKSPIKCCKKNRISDSDDPDASAAIEVKPEVKVKKKKKNLEEEEKTKEEKEEVDKEETKNKKKKKKKYEEADIDEEVKRAGEIYKIKMENEEEKKKSKKRAKEKLEEEENEDKKIKKEDEEEKKRSRKKLKEPKIKEEVNTTKKHEEMNKPTKEYETQEEDTKTERKKEKIRKTTLVEGKAEVVSETQEGVEDFDFIKPDQDTIQSPSAKCKRKRKKKITVEEEEQSKSSEDENHGANDFFSDVRVKLEQDASDSESFRPRKKDRKRKKSHSRSDEEKEDDGTINVEEESMHKNVKIKREPNTSDVEDFKPSKKKCKRENSVGNFFEHVKIKIEPDASDIEESRTFKSRLKKEPVDVLKNRCNVNTPETI